MNAPHYAVYFMLDEPHGNKSTGGYSTAGAVSAPAAGRVIAKIGPMLGLLPDMAQVPAITQALSIPMQPGRGYVSRWAGPLTFVPPSTPLPSAPVAETQPNVPAVRPATHERAVRARHLAGPAPATRRPHAGHAAARGEPGHPSCGSLTCSGPRTSPCRRHATRGRHRHHGR